MKKKLKKERNMEKSEEERIEEIKKRQREGIEGKNCKEEWKKVNTGKQGQMDGSKKIEGIKERKKKARMDWKNEGWTKGSKERRKEG